MPFFFNLIEFTLSFLDFISLWLLIIALILLGLVYFSYIKNKIFTYSSYVMLFLTLISSFTSSYKYQENATSNNNQLKFLKEHKLIAEEKEKNSVIFTGRIVNFKNSSVTLKTISNTNVIVLLSELDLSNKYELKVKCYESVGIDPSGIPSYKQCKILDKKISSDYIEEEKKLVENEKKILKERKNLISNKIAFFGLTYQEFDNKMLNLGFKSPYEKTYEPDIDSKIEIKWVGNKYNLIVTFYRGVSVFITILDRLRESSNGYDFIPILSDYDRTEIISIFTNNIKRDSVYLNHFFNLDFHYLNTGVAQGSIDMVDIRWNYYHKNFEKDEDIVKYEY